MANALIEQEVTAGPTGRPETADGAHPRPQWITILSCQASLRHKRETGHQRELEPRFDTVARK